MSRKFSRSAAALCYTSGTTGHPKGVLYSHRSTLLHAFAGAAPAPRGRTARVTSIVDIEDVDLALVERLSAHLLGATQGRQPSDSPISLDIAHDPLRRCAKFIIHASPADTATLLGFVDACLEPQP